MWATLHTFEHNNLEGMRLIPAPKYGQTLLRSWARKHRSAITLFKNSAGNRFFDSRTWGEGGVRRNQSSSAPKAR